MPPDKVPPKQLRLPGIGGKTGESLRATPVASPLLQLGKISSGRGISSGNAWSSQIHSPRWRDSPAAACRGQEAPVLLGVGASDDFLAKKQRLGTSALPRADVPEAGLDSSSCSPYNHWDSHWVPTGIAPIQHRPQTPNPPCSGPGAPSPAGRQPRGGTRAPGGTPGQGGSSVPSLLSTPLKSWRFPLAKTQLGLSSARAPSLSHPR